MYTFSTLNDKEFENLTRDLLNKNLQLNFQTFKSGKDKGIDLRYSTIDNENKIIVQVKHYLHSGYSVLKNNLKNEEVRKVRLLNPERYIFVTSLGLSPQNKEEIKEIFNPYILNTQDIYGQDELKSLLRDFEDIEKKHPKLWFSSTSVLEKILKNGVLGRSEFAKESIENKVKLFVPCSTYSKAVELLNKNNFIVIIGEPGVGKTITANILTYKLLELDYELIYVFDVKEAEELFNTSKNQVFYFDDFLGANYYEFSLGKNNDSAIIHFINRIINSKNKKLILTSRTIILNRAKEDSEKIFNSNIDISQFEVKIDNYSDYDKAKILYNHIYFSQLDWVYKDTFFEDKFYFNIIKHRNYSPRIIEFITDYHKMSKIEKTQYKNSIIEKLDNPQDVWKKSYEKQISEFSKIFINTLFSLKTTYEISIKEAFESRVNYEVKNNGLKKVGNVFNQTLKELLGGFINRKIINYNSFKYETIHFFNPSIVDFLIKYISEEDKNEIWDILKSSVFYEQFTTRFSTNANSNSNNGKIVIRNGDIGMFKSIFFERYEELKSISQNKKISGINTIFALFDINSSKKIIEEKLIDLNTSSELNNNNHNIFDFFELLDNIEEANLITQNIYLLRKIFICISNSLKSIRDIRELYEYIDTNSTYNEIYKNFIENDSDFKELFQESINEVWETDFTEYLLNTNKINDVLDKDELIDIIENRIDSGKIINNHLHLSSPLIFDDDIENFLDLDDIISENHYQQNNYKESITDFETTKESRLEEIEKIDSLFEKPF